MGSVAEGLEERGVPSDRCHAEAFGPASIKKAKPAGAPAEGSGAKVSFAKAGKDLTWDGSADTLLELGEANGIEMESGCRAGDCHACKVALKSGKVKYLKEPPEKPEPGTCLACIAMPDGDVSLDA